MERNLRSKTEVDRRLAAKNPLVIWRIRDGRIGHDNQSLGLVNAIASLVPVELHNINPAGPVTGIVNYLLHRFPPGDGIPVPDLIIGAGHGTHFSMICARRAFGGKTVVIMRPTFPTDWFDVCLIPDHDKPTIKNNIIITHGALNNIQPSSRHDMTRGIILVGGPSKHYDWDVQLLLEQVETIITKMPEVMWLISDSPRTPAGTTLRLREITLPNARFVLHTEMEKDWVANQLQLAGYAWVTADSVSMIYESLTSGAITGLITVPSGKKDKITNIVHELHRARMITRFEDWTPGRKLAVPPVNFHEAKRCAGELLGRIQNDFPVQPSPE